LEALSSTALDSILADLAVEPLIVRLASAAPGPAGSVTSAAGRPTLMLLPGSPADEDLAALRDALWPALHVSAVYRGGADGGVRRQTLTGAETLPGSAGEPFTALLAWRRADAMGQEQTRAKFDANAAGWNGNPGSPTYGHYRWMRRLVALVARPLAGQRVVDAGCGTGWVGIEAARLGATLAVFDGSPGMIEIARANAAQTGVEVDARVGFVEQAPFERPFDVVLNSGVISFAPDPAVYLAALDRLVEPGGLLVIGDMNPLSRGFRRRRRSRPLLPTRELSGLPREQVAELLVARGYRLESARYYQLTRPVPQLMALSERSAGGLGCGALLLLNRAASALDAALGSHTAGSFDSWILRARKQPVAKVPAARPQ
jgi:2-polyprenyl-3-methyl-5-hydroxy-6-metoxy-1,4-benzoquinol methylase